MDGLIKNAHGMRKIMLNAKFVLCPVCKNKTRVQIREDTELKNFPLYCPKCRQETLINAKELHITAIKEPDTLDAEPMNV
jgi:Zn finger protein HypA/HybF involved in hydrogenase expression